MEILSLLETAIGLTLIFLVLSLICSAWVEAISNWAGLRGETLRELLKVQTGGDEIVANLLLSQPSLRALFSDAPPYKVSGWLRSLAALSGRAKSHTQGFRPPSYIPPDRFAQALLEMTVGDDWIRMRRQPEWLETRLNERAIKNCLIAASAHSFGAAMEDVLVIPKDCCAIDDAQAKAAAGHLANVLQQLWRQSDGDPEAFLAAIEQWFEDGTDRAKGWFKRKLAPKLFWAGLIVALTLNVDTLQILSRLSTDSELRQTVVQMAVERAQQPPPRIASGQGDGAQTGEQLDAPQLQGRLDGERAEPSEPALQQLTESNQRLVQQFEQAQRELLALEPLLGWRSSSLPDGDNIGWWLFGKFFGLLATAIALSLGAPFWFDMLRKLLRARAAVRGAQTEGPGTAAAAVGSAGQAEKPKSSAMNGESGPPQADRLVTGMMGLAPLAADPDPQNARWMARLAVLAYEPEQEKLAEALGPLQLNLDYWLHHRGSSSGEGIDKIDTIDTQGFVASNQDLVVVAFRGTEVAADNVADVLTDAQAWKQSLDWFDGLEGPDRPRAHHGFVEALDAAWDELWGALTELGAANPSRPIWFTGHSLGGALAVLAASRYELERRRENRRRETLAEEWLKDGDGADVHARIRAEAAPLPPVARIHTIGQPAVGDERLADWLSATFGQRLVRTINNRDVVPRLPSSLIGYAHAGTQFYFDSFGRMKINPSAWYRGLDALVIDPNQIRERAREAVGDHKAETYVGLLTSRSAMV